MDPNPLPDEWNSEDLREILEVAVDDHLKLSAATTVGWTASDDLDHVVWGTVINDPLIDEIDLTIDDL